MLKKQIIQTNIVIDDTNLYIHYVCDELNEEYKIESKKHIRKGKEW